MELKDKKVLLMGLGILGGGVATAKWLHKKGAILTITDMKEEEHLEASLHALKDLPDIKYTIGRHDEKDFLENDIIVVNPDVPATSPFVKMARDAGKQIENELSLFYKFCPTDKIVAITGTRGKTTTTNWTYHFLKSVFPNTLIGGNSPDNPFLKIADECDTDSIVVLEVPSFQLELVANMQMKAPKVAVITNLYQDHLNRHGTMAGYARAKANIFSNQTESDILILDRQDDWTKFFIDLKPKSEVLIADDNPIWSAKELEVFTKEWGNHNVKNLLFASLVALKMGVPIENIKEGVTTLPSIKFRQEKVYEDDQISIWNDTAATSPEATMAALDRFAPRGVVLITGGTDRDLEYSKWGESVNRLLSKEQVIMLAGSATEKMKKVLGWEKYQEFDTLEECIDKAMEIASRFDLKHILFSPSAKSFEKFKNEFDRGEKFNALVKEKFNK